MVVAKDVEERTTSAPRVNERKQTGTQNFNTKDYKCHSHSALAGYRSKLSRYVKEMHLLVRLIVYTDCEMVRDFICGYLLPCVLTHSLTYLLTYLLTYIHNYLLTYILTYIHNYLLTYILTYIHNYLLTYILTYLHNYLLTYILTYIHNYLLTYILTYIHNYLHIHAIP